MTIVYSPEENETILNSTNFIGTVEDKVSFISETRAFLLNVPHKWTVALMDSLVVYTEW